MMATTTVRRPGLADPSDPRFQGLAFDDGTPRYAIRVTPSVDASRLAEGFLRSNGWHVHRVGAARCAHGPNGCRWIYAWAIDGEEPPAWLSRLAARSAASLGATMARSGR